MLRPATAADFGFIRSLTTNPDYSAFIGDSDAAELMRWLTDPAIKILIWGDQAGFAIFRDIGNPAGRVELFRLALAHLNGGQGAPFVQALIDHAFTDLNATRLSLDASGENPRAHRLYLKLGFQQEGRLRQHWHRPQLGRAVDVVLYGMLRAEWAALTA